MGIINEMTTIAKSLKKHLKGLELKKVSKDCKIPQSTLHGWLNNATPSLRSVEQLQRLCSYLSLDLSELILDSSMALKSEVITSTIFSDGKTKYKITVEKLK